MDSIEAKGAGDMVFANSNALNGLGVSFLRNERFMNREFWLWGCILLRSYTFPVRAVL